MRGYLLSSVAVAALTYGRSLPILPLFLGTENNNSGFI
jgi:hypothetical protein